MIESDTGKKSAQKLMTSIRILSFPAISVRQETLKKTAPTIDRIRVVCLDSEEIHYYAGI
jgi:hypothetical protein